MKMQKRMAMVVLAGLAAVALVAGPERARGIQAGAVQSQPAVEQQSGADLSLAANGDYSGESLLADDIAASPATAQEAELGRAMILNLIGLAILLAGMGSIVACTILATRRRDLQPVLRDHVAGMNAYGAASGAISR